jgi:metal-dependent amidase/aminoacylase/carboxypeptidase family protein
LHQIPETSYEEYLTSEYVAKELAALGIEVTTGL